MRLYALFHSPVNRAGAEETAGYKVITAAELRKIQESAQPILIIAALPVSGCEQGHIPGSKRFEFPNGSMDQWDPSKTGDKNKDDFAPLLGDDKEKPVVFYCQDEK